MRFSVISIFPEIFDSFLQTSLVGKAVAAGRVQVELVDPRDFTRDRHRSTDDTPLRRRRGHGDEARAAGGGLERSTREAERSSDPADPTGSSRCGRRRSRR